MAEIRTVKKEMREKYMAMRNEMPADMRASFDKRIFDRICASITYRHSNEILLYASMNSEIDTWHLFETALRNGKKVAFPRTYDDNTMRFFYCTSKDDMEKRSNGIYEPFETLPEYVPNPLTICVIPAIVFDKDGYRIGYGRGFYDRFLSDFPGVKMGLVYSSMIVPKVPRGRFDKYVDIIISERGVVAVNAPK